MTNKNKEIINFKSTKLQHQMKYSCTCPSAMHNKPQRPKIKPFQPSSRISSNNTNTLSKHKNLKGQSNQQNLHNLSLIGIWNTIYKIQSNDSILLNSNYHHQTMIYVYIITQVVGKLLYVIFYLLKYHLNHKQMTTHLYYLSRKYDGFLTQWPGSI